MLISKNMILIAGVGVAAVLGVAWWNGRKSGGGTFFSIGTGAGNAVADFASGLFSAPVYAIGDAVGLPRTDMTECERAMAEGGHGTPVFHVLQKHF